MQVIDKVQFDLKGDINPYEQLCNTNKLSVYIETLLLSELQLSMNCICI